MASIEVSEEAGVRFLHFGSTWVQGAMRVRKPWALELEYTREMFSPLLFRDHDWPKSTLIIGLGAGSLCKFLHRHSPQSRITVVEIDPRVVAVAAQHFHLPEDENRLNIVIGDGADFIKTTPHSFDLILVDGFDAKARAGALETEPFYRDCKHRLNPAGILSVNLFGRKRGHKTRFANLHTAFDGHAISFPSTDAGNSIALACPDQVLSLDLPELIQASLRLKAKTELDLSPMLARLGRVLKPKK